MPRLRLVLAALVLATMVAGGALAVQNLRGTARDDLIRGGQGSDLLRGFAGDDILEGLGGPDWLLGGRGADILRGGTGPDSLFGGPGPDTAYGGPGDDLLKMATDRTPDVLICGPGVDVVLVDRFDAVADDCEIVRRTLPVGSAPTAVTLEFLGWASAAAPRAALADGPSVPAGGTLTACGREDQRLDAFLRVHGITRRTSVRVEFDFPSGNTPVLLDSVQPFEEGRQIAYSFFAARGRPLANGAYTIRFQVEAAGVYTAAGEETVTRACP